MLNKKLELSFFSVAIMNDEWRMTDNKKSWNIFFSVTILNDEWRMTDYKYNSLFISFLAAMNDKWRMTDGGRTNDGCRKKALNRRERDILVRDILLRDILVKNIEKGKTGKDHLVSGLWSQSERDILLRNIFITEILVRDILIRNKTINYILRFKDWWRMTDLCHW